MKKLVVNADQLKIRLPEVAGNTVLTICGKTKKVRMRSELSCREDDMIDLVFVDQKNSNNEVAEHILLVDAQDSSKQMSMNDVSKKGSNESNLTHEDIIHNEISKVTDNYYDLDVGQSILTNSSSDVDEGRSCLKGVKEMNKKNIILTKKSTRSVSEISLTLNDDSDDSTIYENSDELEYDEILETFESQKDSEHVTQSLEDSLYYDQSDSETERHSIDENHYVSIKIDRDDDNVALGDKKIFSCPSPGCIKSYTYLKSFVLHQQSHNGKKPYVCDEPGCSRDFNTLNSLKNHTRVHSGEKPFKCDYANCQKRFTHSRGLACHKRKHSAIKKGALKVKRRKTKR
ncbi:zinc finger protein [Gigaspora margarita]|uniref:Zinc finger protein n=1 Tax=Gigaspora margarita TaxID=4874 RepID=A0A8H4ESQ1_GIGMA|nr:zinc finger protein [Gigaspora margarita]